MASIAPEVLPVLALFAPAFSQPTFLRVQLLVVAAILTTGRRTVCNLLRTVRCLTQGDSSSYHRVLSLAQWSGLTLARLLVHFLVQHFCPTGTIVLLGDDTVSEHRGKKVHGKARHRDAVRSSKSYTAYRYGHKWVVLAMLLRFPWAARAWALPVLTALYRSKEDNKKRGRSHKTPAQLMQLLLRVVLRWLPERKFCFAGDTGFGSHDMAHFAQKKVSGLTLLSRFSADANLYEEPPPYGGNGRPRVKGKKLPAPQEVVAGSARTRLAGVAWYGGEQRDVEVVSGVGWWYKSGVGLVALRWVYVHDLTGTHRDDYLYSTDVNLSAQEIIEGYTARWHIETTFAEMRAYLGLESTRGWCPQTVHRAEPMLFGLYSVVALLFDQLPAAERQGGVQWRGKKGVTFSDAISAVRRWLWQKWVFARADHDAAFAKLPDSLQQVLLYALAPAA